MSPLVLRLLNRYRQPRAYPGTIDRYVGHTFMGASPMNTVRYVQKMGLRPAIFYA